MPVASKPRYFVIGKRCVTLVWSKSLSCVEFQNTNNTSKLMIIQTVCQKKRTHIDQQILTGTFFWVTTQTESFPLTPIEVIPAALTALKAYSTYLFREINKNPNPDLNISQYSFSLLSKARKNKTKCDTSK